MKRITMPVLLFIAIGSLPLSGQIKPPEAPLTPEEYEPDEFPLWSQDVRRFEVITFGSFPLTYFLSSLIYDVTLLAINNGSPEFELGSQRGEQDLPIIIGAAGIASVLVAVVDLIITLSKRNASEKHEKRQLPHPNP